MPTPWPHASTPTPVSIWQVVLVAPGGVTATWYTGGGVVTANLLGWWDGAAVQPIMPTVRHWDGDAAVPL